MEKKIDSIVVGDIETNCWLYALDGTLPAADGTPPEADGKRPCVVIDPGGDAQAIAARLGELNWTPRFILLTHGHFDHLSALPKLLAGYAGGDLPKIGIHSGDGHYLGKAALTAHRDSFAAAGGSAAYVDALWQPLPEADIFFAERDSVGPFKVLHVPGHTGGSVCFYDEAARILFTGDTLFQGDYGRTDLPGGDWNQLRQSLKRLLGMKGDTIVCPGHGEPTTIKEEAHIRLDLG